MEPLALHRMRAKFESLPGRNIRRFKINTIDETFRLECAGLLPRYHSYHIVSLLPRRTTRLTSALRGIVIPLLDAKVMATCIIGSALESLAIQNLISEYRETLEELVSSREPPLVVQYLHALMRVRGRMADQLIMKNIYAMSGVMHRNVEIWSSARSLADAKARLNGKLGMILQAGRLCVFTPFTES